MGAPKATAFDKFETWRSRRSPLFSTSFPARPLKTGLQAGEGKSSGIIVDVDLSSERITMLEGTPETGQRHVQFELSGASFAIAADPPARLTVEFREGGRVFFVEKSLREIQLTASKKRGI